MLLTVIMKSMKQARLNQWLFLKKFFRNPRDTGSITPSSARLTRKMLESVEWDTINNIVELGAGTGVFTRGISENIRPDCKVAVFEKDDEMRSRLQEQYSNFYFYKDALDLKNSLAGIGMAKADCIISGLPFANFSQETRSKIIGQIKASLQDDGVFVTFQYSLQMRKMLQNEFGHVKISLVPWNIPSAFVYECRKTQ